MGFILSSLLTLYVSTRVGRTESELEPVTVPIRNTGWKESDIRISIGIRIRIAGHYPGPRIRIGVRIMVRFGTDNSGDMQYWMEKLRYQNQNQLMLLLMVLLLSLLQVLLCCCCFVS